MSRRRFSPRRQLPVLSPLPVSALAHAVTALVAGERPRERLRARLIERFAADQAVLFGSGTQALTAAIRVAMDAAGADRAVALPAYTCYDMATAAAGAGARIMLYDIDPLTLAPDWESLEAALRAGAGVAVLAPLYGYPFDWAAAEDLAGRYGAALIEDAAQAAGGEWDGRPAGTFGALTVLSFGRGKGWTGGGGGALLVRGDKGPAAAWKAAGLGSGGGQTGEELASVAAAGAQWLLARPSIYGVPHGLPMLHLGETVYHPPGPERAMTRASAALALATEAASLTEIDARRGAADLLMTMLEPLEAIRPTTAPARARPGYLRLPCLAPAATREPTTLAALGRHGVETGYPTTLAALPVVEEIMAAGGPTRFPGAETLATDLITLPTHSRTAAKDFSEIVRLIGA